MANVSPAPGSAVSDLSQLSVTFAMPVMGVVAEDLILNGTSATNVTSSGNRYTFFFPPSVAGAVQASWNGAHHITDLATNRLNDLGANTVWQYTLLDNKPPTVAALNPVPGSTLSHLTQVSVTFSEPVGAVEASDLLVNGQPASQVSGTGAGPYTFQFNTPDAGMVQFTWAASHGIHDLAPAANALVATNWTYALRPGEFSGNIIINEFLASNTLTNGLRDEDGELQDWIELLNRGTTPVNLNGWSLSDDPEQPDAWVFPAVTINPGAYLIVFASGKDRAPSNGGKLHTSFKLSTSGRYLGLFNPNYPREVATQFLPAYPRQRPDIAYGLQGGTFGYLTGPTPGTANTGLATFVGLADDPGANIKSGFFNRPFSVTLSTPSPGATIRYTLDGSEPTPTSGILVTGPVAVAGTPLRAAVMLRAVAYRDDLLSSRVVTYTYIFPENVLTQPENPAGFPGTWDAQLAPGDVEFTSVPADYQMDPRVVGNAAYTDLIRKALTNLPTLSIVGNADDLFSQSRGIYANPNPMKSDRAYWERPASAELVLPDGGDGFRINAGLRIHGSTSRDPNWTRKHSLRLFFRSAYDGKLNYQMFPDSPVTSFSTLILSAGFNVSWVNRFELASCRGQFVRNQFCSDLQRAMNHPSAHGRFIHLYVNGLYWGLYDLEERPDENFAATYFGGAAADYDVVRNTQGFFEVVAGDANAWSSMMALINAGLADNAQYEQLRQYLDVDAFIDYMIVNQYAGNTDWANHNWYALRKRTPGAGFEFVSWDAEIALKELNENVTGYNQLESPTMIHSFLKNNAEYVLRFNDRVRKHFSEGGTLFVDAANSAIDPANPQRNAPGSLYMRRIAEIDSAVVAESARWGDSTPPRASSPFTRSDFLTELNWMKTTYLPQRSAIVLDQFRSQLLYPGAWGVAPPVFNQAGGNVPRGFSLTMSAPSGTIYYTTNGSDPRVYGSGAVSADAIAYAGPALTINRTILVRARVLKGANWGPLTEATFSVAQLLLPLRITELMTSPSGGSTYQFVELFNAGPTTLDLGGCSFSDGISFLFPAGFTIAPGAVIVLANSQNPSAFAARYPGVTVAGYFGKNIAKSGERVALSDALGRTIISVNYTNANGWPVPANNGSLEIIDPTGDPNDPANWRASSNSTGSPGTVAPLPLSPPVQINELTVINSGSLTNGGTTPGWIELANTTSSAVSLTGWSLSDNGQPGKFAFPSGTILAGGGMLLLFCDSQAGAPGLHTGFALNPQGGSLSLFNAQTQRVDAVTYGPQVAGLSLGRVAGVWQPTSPSPSGANQVAATGAASSLVLNEWMSSSAPGQFDWFELYNPSAVPVLLRGLYVGTTNALFRISSLTFIPSHGFLQLIADKQSGPTHVDFKLPAGGGSILLYDAYGAQLNRVDYGPQVDGISQGRLPDGSATLVSFPGSASPAASNFQLSNNGPRLNEILVRNHGAVADPFGGNAGWVELYNPDAVSANLSGMSLSLGSMIPGQWVFPAGTTLAAGGYRVIWCDSSHPASTSGQAAFNTGQSLDDNSGAVYLFNAAGQVVDYVEYGFQLLNQPIGRSGGNWRLLATPTPGVANSSAAALGSVYDLRFNEWMAAPLSGNDWFELYNLSPQPVDLGGLYLTDDPSLFGQTKNAIAPLSFIAGHGWVKWTADGSPKQGRNHVNFQLSTGGDGLRLYGADLSLIDAVDTSAQQPGVSQGRLPDGSSAITSFAATPTPGEGNYVPLTNAVINEVLTHTDPPLEDAIELANPNATPLDISGWYLSDSQSEPKKYRVPNGTMLAANGFRVFYENQFNPTPGFFPSFALDAAHGDSVYLSQTDSSGNLTGARTSVQFGAAQNGVSFGRFASSTGIEFVAMSQRSFGVDTPATLAQFRTGTGLVNAYPKVGPVVINEVMYHPVTVSGTNIVENPDEEFIELYNFSTNAVSLFDPNSPTNTWHLRGGIDFAFPMGAVIAAQSILVVVDFDPVANPAALATFRARFGVDTTTTFFGPFKGRLSDEGESLELYKPDPPSTLGADQGFVPYVLVDRLNYGVTAPWPVAAAGGGASLQRRVSEAFGNDPLNWKGEAPTAGHANAAGTVSPPVITAQPQSQTVAAGETVGLSVGASGSTPLSYRWNREGVDLPGATSATLTINHALPGDSGTYRVWVANAAGSIYSQPAVLSVYAPPIILVQPSAISVSWGAQVTFLVSAGGSAPLRFQWLFNGSPLAGATNATLTLSGVDPEQSGTYQVLVINPAGVAVSQPASLTVGGVDTDGDGIPDSWEIGHGLNPLDPTDALQDDDHDGMTNLQEYQAGTDPRDPASGLKLRALTQPGGSGLPQFSFTAVAGVSYSVQSRDSLSAGAWHKLYDVPADPATRAVNLADPTSTNSAMRFYRVVTPIQP